MITTDSLEDAVASDDRRSTAIATRNEPRLASEVFLFLHAGGVPPESAARQLRTLGCFGKPDAWFDPDGLMWSEMRRNEAASFTDYLESLIDWSDDARDDGGGVLSALVDYRDLLWLEQRPIFQDQLRQRLRAVGLAFLDPALQAYRRWRTAEAQRRSPSDDAGSPGFADLARELILIEEAERQGEAFFQRHGLPGVKLWVEDLARPGLPALRSLLARWSIPLPDDDRFLPIEQPTPAELEIVAAFRAEAARRHWSHALLPRVMR